MRTLITLALILLLAPLTVSANEGGGSYIGPFKFNKYHADYNIHADGTHTETFEYEIEVLTERGVEGINQVDITYSEGLNDIKIISAYTLKSDGRRIDVPESNIQDRAAIAGGGPAYSDIKARVIIFPDVAVGDKVVYSYKLKQKIPLFPGHFSTSHAFSESIINEDVQVSVSAPSGGPHLNIFTHGVSGGRLAERNGRRRWSWKYTNHEVVRPERASVAYIDYGPRIFVSTFKDYGEVAAAYEKRARPMAEVTEKVRALAEEITGGITDRRAQVEAIYTWVSQNIHYAGNCVGVGAVVPHHVDMVLTNKLGDCKDHAALMQALLEAKGIESTTALVNYGTSFKLPKVATINPINHVINYVPEFDVYLDSTAQFIPFGQLPLPESGKPVVHTANYSGIRVTPSSDHRRNSTHMKLRLVINPDGSADGVASNKESGVFSHGVRAAMSRIPENLPKEIEDTIMRGILSQGGYTGTGTLIMSNPREMSDSYSYGSEFHIDEAISLPGPGAFKVLPVFSSAVPLSQLVSDLNMPERTIDFPCFGGTATEEYEIVLPEGVKVTSLPKDVHASSEHLRYDAVYTQDGNTIRVFRQMQDRMSSRICTPEDDREGKKIDRVVFKDLKSQIIYE